MDRYIYLEPTVRLQPNQCLLPSPLPEQLNLLVKLIYGNKLVKILVLGQKYVHHRIFLHVKFSNAIYDLSA